MKKIAVFTGGGADGAVTVGRLEVLNKDYDIGIGISTGSLIVVKALLKKYQDLKNLYTNITTEDITEDSAFLSDGKVNVPKAIWRTLLSFFGGRKTLGSSENLRDLIDLNLSQYEYESLGNKEALVGVYSLTKEETKYFSSKKEKLSDFKDWMWGSANPPIAFSILKKNKQEWCDGGLQEVTPINLAVSLAQPGDEIDVFMHRPKPKHFNNDPIKNIIQYIVKVIKLLFKESDEKDIRQGIQFAALKKVNLNIYWMGHEVRENSLVFNKKDMLTRYKLGKNWAKRENLIDRYEAPLDN